MRIYSLKVTADIAKGFVPSPPQGYGLPRNMELSMVKFFAIQESIWLLLIKPILVFKLLTKVESCNEFKFFCLLVLWILSQTFADWVAERISFGTSPFVSNYNAVHKQLSPGLHVDCKQILTAK